MEIKKFYSPKFSLSEANKDFINTKYAKILGKLHIKDKSSYLSIDKIKKQFIAHLTVKVIHKGKENTIVIEGSGYDFHQTFNDMFLVLENNLKALK